LHEWQKERRATQILLLPSTLELEPDDQQRLQTVLRALTGQSNVVIIDTSDTNVAADANVIAVTVRVPNASDELGFKIICFRSRLLEMANRYLINTSVI